MRNNFLNLVAKMPQNTGGGTSRTKNRSVTVNLSSDTTTNREMTERRPREDRETFGLRSSLLGTLKYVACMLLALVLGVGNMWGADRYVYGKTAVNANGTLTTSSGKNIMVRTADGGTSYTNVTEFFSFDENIASSTASVYMTNNEATTSSSSAQLQVLKWKKNKTTKIQWTNEKIKIKKLHIYALECSSNATKMTISNGTNSEEYTVTKKAGSSQVLLSEKEITMDFDSESGISIQVENKEDVSALIIFEADDYVEITNGDTQAFQGESIPMYANVSGVTWSVAGDATIDPTTGLLSINADATGTVIVTCTKAGKTDTRNITVQSGSTKQVTWNFATLTSGAVYGSGVQSNIAATDVSYQGGFVNLANNWVGVDVSVTGYKIIAASFNVKTPSGSSKKVDYDYLATGDKSAKGTHTTTTSEYETASVASIGEETAFRIWKNSTVTQVKSLTLTLKKVVKHQVTYNLNGGTGVEAPTQADVAQGGTFTVAAMPGGVTPPTGTKFSAWNDGNHDYEAGDTYTMGTSDVTLTAQWVDDLPDPTATFVDATYIIGSGTLNMASKFSSNSEGAVTYALKEASENASITSAGVFSATAAGEYVVVANQAQVPSTYAAISKEATVTVLDNELTDTYVWKKAKYTGSCVASPNADAPAAQYTSVTVDGMASVATGRPGTAETDVTITIAATQTGFGITSLCVYGKSEEAAGFKYSWDGGAHWTDVAPVKDGDDQYIDAKFTFNAPAGTFPDNIIIKFTEAEAGKGGLWLRNALVTLQVKKTVASTVVELNNVKVNGTAISAANLSSLLTHKNLAITTEYAAAPTVTFVKRTTVNYEGGWAADVTDEEIDVTASDASTVWSASQEIGENTYAITLAKPSEPSLETAATDFTLTSTKNATAQETFTFSGLNLDHSVAISLASEVAGMSVSPAVVIPVAGAITDEEVTISYKSLENVAEANVNLIVSYSETVKLTIPLTYSSTKGWDTPNNVNGSITWDFAKAASGDVTISNSEVTVLANYDVENDPTKVVTDNLAGKGEKFSNKWLRTFYLQFTTTVNGKLAMEYSDTGSSSGRRTRYMYVNGNRYGEGSNTSASHALGDPVYVPAGTITLTAKIDTEGKEEAQWNDANVQLYQMVFTETHDITFVDGGSIAAIHAVDGETVSLPAVDPSDAPTGKLFIGWYIGEDKVGDAGDDYTMGNADVEMTAKFSTPAETPVINAQPVGSAYCVGNEPTLTVGVNAVSDGGTLHYAWYKKGDTDTQVGSDAASYTVESAGTYYVKVTNSKTGSADATVTSSDAVVTQNVGAEITVQPAALQVVSAGDAVELSVTATNATAYQWYKGGVLIEGAQAATYNFTAAVGAATYYCVVAGACGNVQSNNAVVYVESGDCNTAGYGDGASNVFGTKGSEIALGSYVTYKYSKSPSDFNILVGSTSTGVKAHKMDGEFYVWTANTELAAITTSVLTEGSTGGKYCVVFYDVAGYQPDASHIISVVELTAGLKEAAQTFDVTPAPAGAKCARLIREVEWNETTYGESSQTYIYAFRACALVPAEKPVISGDLSDLAVCTFGSEDLSVTVDAVSDGGTLSYQWYNADGDVAITGEESASYTPTAVGSYYVIVTNTLAGSPSSSTKSEIATVSLKAQTEITGFENAAAPLNTEKTLSVTAAGTGTLTYKWQACTEAGVVTDENVLSSAATYGVTITEEPQYYLVTVEGECGSATQVLFAKKWADLELVDVDGSMTWNFAASNTGITGDVAVPSTMVLANAGQGAMPNTDNFHSDMLKAIVGTTETAVRKSTDDGCYQGDGIMFHTTVPGIVTVTYRGTGNSANVTLTVGSKTFDTYHGGFTTCDKVFVPAGDVEISSVGTMRIQKIVFNATPGYTRDVTEGRFGTICLPNGGVMVGAELFEIAYYGETSQKVFLDNIINGEMEAGRPYIFLPKEGATQLAVFYTDEANASQGNHNGLIGFIGAAADEYFNIPAGEGNYILQNNLYREVPAGAWARIKSNRAYIKLSAINPHEAALAPGRRRISMGVQSEQVATGIDELNASEAPVKVMIDGQLFIIRGEKMYNANGQLVK